MNFDNDSWADLAQGLTFGLEADELADMRLWMADSPWCEMGLDEVGGLSADEVARWIDRYYEAGVLGFLRDREV